MKQTKKLTRAQRVILEENGYKDTYNIRYLKSNDREIVFYDTVNKEEIHIIN